MLRVRLAAGLIQFPDGVRELELPDLVAWDLILTGQAELIREDETYAVQTPPEAAVTRRPRRR